MKPIHAVAACTLVFAATTASAAELTVEMKKLGPEGQGDSIGTVTLRDNEAGLLVIPELKGLEPGLHGFHVHAKPDCGSASKDGKQVPGLAAGGHYDPEDSGRHEGPVGKGHLGDLPALLVDGQGNATLPVVAPRLKTADVAKRSLMIHAEGDNYSDQPKPLGGGGARVACGLIGTDGG